MKELLFIMFLSGAALADEVDVEVHDQAQGHSETTRFRLTVGATGPAASLMTTVADDAYEMSLRRDRDDAPSYLVELTRHGKGRDLRVVASRVLQSGKRQVVTGVDRPDGSRTEVALTLRQ